MQNISGSIVALITPFKQDGSIAWKILENLIEWHIESGTKALVVLGTTAESATLTEQEKTDIIQIVVKVSSGRIPIIVGAGSNCTEFAISATQKYSSMGVSATLQVTPYYNLPSQQGLVAHFFAIADKTSLPMILYNVPSRTCVSLDIATIVQLAEHNNIIGIKDASGDIEKGMAIKKLCKDFILYSGDDESCGELMRGAGASGCISVMANLLPQSLQRYCEYSMKGETDSQLELALQRLNQVLACDTNPVAIKYAMSYRQIIHNQLRLPLLSMEGGAKINSILDTLNNLQ